MKKILLLFLVTCSVYSQSEYPQDYFRNPLDITLVLSGTFAELRSSHFHGGLDIKTQLKQGLKVYGAAEGYVSRIKISHFYYIVSEYSLYYLFSIMSIAKKTISLITPVDKISFSD